MMRSALRTRGACRLPIELASHRRQQYNAIRNRSISGGVVAMAKRVLLRVGLVLSAVGVFYSGLMFLNLVPATMSIRFWDGGPAAMNAAAVLDIACGGVLCYLTAEVLLGIDVHRHARNVLIVCVAAMISDLIGGLYGVSGLIGLVCSYFVLRERGWRTL
jgi:hypothetical protein